jgi:hypothetical protein
MRLLLFFATLLFALHAEEPYLKVQRWKAAVKTPEDFGRLERFASLKGNGKPLTGIPKVLHVVWLEPRALPKKMLASWIERHPGWEINVWSETLEAVCFPTLRLRGREEFPLGALEECYYDAPTTEERSFVLRYAILLKEGGVYINPDLECVASLEPLLAAHDFFCGLAIPGHTFQSSSVQPGCELIAAAKEHPILASATEWMREHWRRFEDLLGATDDLSVQSRLQRRCAHALSIGIEKAACKEGRSDSVFAPHFFYGDKSSSVYSRAPKALFRRQQEAEKEKMQDALKGIHDQLRFSSLLILALGALNLILVIVIVYLYRKRKK